MSATSLSEPAPDPPPTADNRVWSRNVRVVSSVSRASDGDKLVRVGVADTRGRRAHMEDAVMLAERTVRVGRDGARHVLVTGVCDGHGGASVARWLARALPECVLDALTPLLREPLLQIGGAGASDATAVRVHGALTRAAHACQQRLELEIPLRERESEGSTACAVVLIDGGAQLWTLNCGDSRALIVVHAPPRASSNAPPYHAMAVTHDHKPADPREHERISRAGGFVAPAPADGSDVARVLGALSVSRAYGDDALRPFVTYVPDVRGPLRLRATRNDSDTSSAARMRVVVGCDGVFDVLSDNDVAVCVADGDAWSLSPAPAAVRVRNAAYARDSLDNVSVVVVDVVEFARADTRARRRRRRSAQQQQPTPPQSSA